MVLLSAVLTITGLGCSESVSLDVWGLEVKPNPAHVGEEVVFEFNLLIVPTRDIRLSAVVDGETYSMESRTYNVNSRFEWPLGDAANMIAEYGAGTHTAQVVLLDLESNRQLGSNQVSFELVDAAQ